MAIKFILGFFGWLIIIAATIFLNWYRIKRRGLKPHYFAATWSRAIFGLICFIIMTADNGFNAPDFAYPVTLIPYLPHAVYIWSSFYVFFDPGLNALRGKRWNYRGKSSGWLDRSKIIFYYALKVICLIGFVTSIVVLWQ